MSEADTERVLFAADFHLLPDDVPELARFAAFLDHAAGATRDLYLLGDVFDVWVGPRALALKGYATAFRALERAATRGLKMTLIPGNRDFNLDAGTGERLGLQVRGETWTIDLFARRTLLTHGDAFLTDDIAYQRMKRVLRSRPLRFLARHLPLSVSERLAARLRARSRRAVTAKHPRTMRLVPEAVRALTPADARVAICGHVHRPQRQVMLGVELWTLGAFEDGWYLEATRDGFCHRQFAVLP
ncbi:MAG: UDP-2,3-diacylglucosamine diphosphatase [Planctomycetota bacterium]